MQLHWAGSLDTCTWIPQTSPHVSFAFADLALCPFAVISYSGGHSYMLSPVSLPSDPSNRGVPPNNPPLPPERSNASTWVSARKRVQMSDMIASVMSSHS